MPAAPKHLCCFISLVLLGFFPAAWGYFRVGSVGRREVKGASLLYLGFGKACFAALLGFGIYFVGVRL